MSHNFEIFDKYLILLLYKIVDKFKKKNKKRETEKKNKKNYIYIKKTLDIYKKLWQNF